jgi:Methyltransferase domain
VNRIKAVQRALSGRENPVYLEIGVSAGAAFQRISADEKIAVDPAFQLSTRSRELADAKARTTSYFEMTSDKFFANQFLAGKQVDVALIDGLHTYEQALRDIENTLRFLRDDGVIVVHDCNPARAHIADPVASYAELLARKPWWRRNRLWCGDVWKAIVWLRSTRDDLRVAVLKCDFGVGIVRKGSPDSGLHYSAAQIENLSYQDLAADRCRLLNLKDAAYLDELLSG